MQKGGRELAHTFERKFELFFFFISHIKGFCELHLVAPETHLPMGPGGGEEVCPSPRGRDVSSPLKNPC